jgi:uncharacterized Zn-binding protein involved in type VI secretion
VFQKNNSVEGEIMVNRYYITLGAPTTAGGKVVSANHLDTIDGVPVALEGDKCWCSKCNCEGIIMLDGPRISETFNGREVALSDDLCVCECAPPPRLVTAQTFAYQVIDTDSRAAEAVATAKTAEKLNTAETGASDPYRIPILLLDPATDEPFKNRRYRLELGDKVIEGTTDQNGATRPLTAAERTAIVKWDID